MAHADTVEAPPVAPDETTATVVETKFASRDDFLNAAGRFDEEELTIDGIGTLLLSEISGHARAEILGTMAMGLQADPESGEKGKLDTAGYQRALLLNGVVDPSSPPGARKPLFREADMDRVMKVGGAKIQAAAEAIERLSKMGRWSVSAEGNSGRTPNAVSTSG